MPDPDRPVTISFSVKEANELAIAAENGNNENVYVDHAEVAESIARLKTAVQEGSAS